MDILEEIDVFLKACQLTQDESNNLVFNGITGCFESTYLADWFVNQINFGWKLWRQVQAVPEGFVLVPKEPTKEYKDVISQYLDELWMGEWGCDWDGFICVNGIDPNHVWKIVTNTKAMIEAQEQKG